jgi:hypothetical protein
VCRRCAALDDLDNWISGNATKGFFCPKCEAVVRTREVVTPIRPNNNFVYNHQRRRAEYVFVKNAAEGSSKLTVEYPDAPLSHPSYTTTSPKARALSAARFAYRFDKKVLKFVEPTFQKRRRVADRTDPPDQDRTCKTCNMCGCTVEICTVPGAAPLDPEVEP